MRKFWGIVIICIGGLLALVITFGSIPTIIDAINIDLELINKAGYIFGTFLGFAVIGLLPFWLIKTGIKLTKKKTEHQFNEKIESIK